MFLQVQQIWRYLKTSQHLKHFNPCNHRSFSIKYTSSWAGLVNPLVVAEIPCSIHKILCHILLCCYVVIHAVNASYVHKERWIPHTLIMFCIKPPLVTGKPILCRCFPGIPGVKFAISTFAQKHIASLEVIWRLRPEEFEDQHKLLKCSHK